MAPTDAFETFTARMLTQKAAATGRTRSLGLWYRIKGNKYTITIESYLDPAVLI